MSAADGREPTGAGAPMGGPLTRLRWRLTLSHLAAIAFTLLVVTIILGMILVRIFEDPKQKLKQTAEAG